MKMLLFAALASTLSAQNPQPMQNNRPDMALTDQTPAAYNMSARINPMGSWDWFADVSYIYWNVNQDYMDMGRTALFTDTSPGTLNATPAANATVPTPSSEYQSGFKIGIGGSTNCDNWQYELVYTYMHHTNSYHTGSNAGSFPLNSEIIIPNEWYLNLSDDHQQLMGRMASKWKMNLDMLDFLVSRPFYQGKKLMITPYSGLKALWLRQDYDIEAYFAVNPSVAATSLNKSNSWAVGPKIGADCNWYLGQGVRFELDAAVSLLYMRFTDQDHSESYPFLITASLPINGHAPNQGFLRAINELGLGLGWGSYFRNNRYHFDLSARYDFLILWDQNMMRRTVGFLANNDIGYSNPIGNLDLHGLTLTGRFDF